MTYESINRNQVKKEARQLLQQGLPKQEVFNKLKGKYKYAKDIANILEYIPSQQALRKYGVWNYVLLGLIIILAAIFIWHEPSIWFVALFGSLVYVVARMLVRYYTWVSVFAAIIIISFIAIFVAEDESLIDWVNVAAIALLITLVLILPLWLDKKLCPKPNEKKEKYIDKNGNEKVRIVYEFDD